MVYLFHETVNSYKFETVNDIAHVCHFRQAGKIGAKTALTAYRRIDQVSQKFTRTKD